MVASRIWIDGKIHDVEPPDDRTEIPNCQTLASWISLERCIALCSRAEFKRDDQALPIHARKVYGDLSEAALLKHVEMSLGDTQTYRQGYPKLAEIPFNTFNKFQISVHEDTAGKFNFIVMKGAPGSNTIKLLSFTDSFESCDKFASALVVRIFMHATQSSFSLNFG